MLVGYPPIHGRNEWEVFSRTRKGAFKFYEQDWVGISSKARKLVQRMLQVILKTLQCSTSLERFLVLHFKRDGTTTDTNSSGELESKDERKRGRC